MTNAAKAHVERVLQKIPPEIAHAERLRERGQFDEAMKVIGLYLNDHFDDIAALTVASHIMISVGRWGMAHVILSRAVQLEPNIQPLWNNLGLCYQEGSNWEEGETVFHRALKLDPDDAATHMNLGQLYVNMAQPHLALKHCNKSIELDAGIPGAYYERAKANILLQNWRDGWKDYDAVLGVSDIRKERIYGMVPRWNGVKGKTLIAYGEQGLGDEIAFASCLHDLAKDNTVILECHHRLVGLFKRSFGLETHGTRMYEAVPWLHDQKTGARRKVDAAVALGSLPQYYRNETASFSGEPYLVADPERRLQWRALLDSLGPKLKVGIAWTGGNKNTGKYRRSVDLDDLLPILRQDATFVSLQYMPSPDIAELKRTHGIEIHHWKRAAESEDMDDVTALICELDLVITVQTATVHICGAVGQQCWAMLPKQPRWFYGISGSTLPWYRSVKLYRQKFKWVELIAEIATDLRNLINKPKAV